MNIILFDRNREALLPFTYTRSIAEIRCGILTLAEKWEKRISEEGRVSYLTVNYLSEKYATHYAEDNYYINAALSLNDQLYEEIKSIQPGEAMVDGERVLAFRSTDQLKLEELDLSNEMRRRQVEASYIFLENTWDIFSNNGQTLKEDFNLITEGKSSQSLDATCTHIGDQLFIEEGAKVQAAILNSTFGPIYIGKDAEVMEGSVIRGGFALCEGSVLKLSSKIYGPTTVGPYSKVGGEVNNSVIFGYSNKGHDGFLGNSVLGEWCNLGADTNVSNLKNNYASVKVWNYATNRFTDSGRQFCGMMMGDHSKSGINTMFNTATVVGVSANVYGGGFPRNFIPSYAWGGAEKWMVYRYEKAMEVAEKMMERRNKKLDEIERAILKQVFEDSATYRNF